MINAYWTHIDIEGGREGGAVAARVQKLAGIQQRAEAKALGTALLVPGGAPRLEGHGLRVENGVHPVTELLSGGAGSSWAHGHVASFVWPWSEEATVGDASSLSLPFGCCSSDLH